MNADAFLAHASHLMDREDFAGAISSLRAALSEDPDRARAHAMLSICLLRTRRRFAAGHEARLALSLEPELAAGHIASGWAHLAEHALPRAELAFRNALSLRPDDPIALRGLGLVAKGRGDRVTARGHLEKALSLDPESVQSMLDLADLLLDGGELGAADALVTRALAIDPERPSALAFRGEIHLHRGNVPEATEHALWALRQNATSRRALHLLVDIKARENVFLGIWWRWNTWLTRMESARRIVLLVLLYAAYRCALTFSTQHGAEGTAKVILIVWVGFVAYTWAAAPIFRRMLQRELKGVQLRSGF